jgi:hypothetical protein
VEYMALIYADESGWESLAEEQRRAWYDRYRAFADDARAAGVLVAGDELGSTQDATTVRIQDEQVAVTDGPYAEVKEALGGYFLLEADDLDAAIEVASRVPAAAMGGAVEVRPIAQW